MLLGVADGPPGVVAGLGEAAVAALLPPLQQLQLVVLVQMVVLVAAGVGGGGVAVRLAAVAGD